MNSRSAAASRRAVRRAEADRDFVFGIICSLGGVALTVANYQSAVGAGGGTYLLFYGLMAYGVGRIIRGAYTLWLLRR